MKDVKLFTDANKEFVNELNGSSDGGDYGWLAKLSPDHIVAYVPQDYLFFQLLWSMLEEAGQVDGDEQQRIDLMNWLEKYSEKLMEATKETLLTNMLGWWDGE